MARTRKKLLGFAAVGFTATIAIVAYNWRPIAARTITWLALRDAGRIASEGLEPNDGRLTAARFLETAVKPLEAKYAAYFRAGLFDVEYLLDRLPTEIVRSEALPALAVIMARHAAAHPNVNGHLEDPVLEMALGSSRSLVARSSSKELLVNLLVTSHELFTGDDSYKEGLVKREILALLGLPIDGTQHLRHADRLVVGGFPSQESSEFVGSLDDASWRAIARDCEHPREKVRAGSLLLLYSHPSRAIFAEKAGQALADPSEWVRLAAAGTLAFSGSRLGESELLKGLSHPRWEARFWCALGLRAISLPRYAGPMRRRAGEEPDAWVRECLEQWAEEALRVFPLDDWQRCLPADANMDASALYAFESHVAGRGCVVRHGYLVHTWGDVSRRGDIASAAKPIYVHFLFQAVHDGRFAGIDSPVSQVEPRLLTLNPALDHKDAQITWRHLANQVSCYGVTEAPGTAFDYSDFNMAFFFDSLLLKTYNVTRAELDKEVLHERLANRIQCQDGLTFFAFGFDDRPGRVAISPRDFARFGLLYLRNGKWNDTQLIDEYDVHLATTSPLPNSIPRTEGKSVEMLPKQRSIGGGNNQTDHLGSYSFAWWTNGVDREGKRHWPDAPLDAYGAFGHGGMRALVIIPSLGLVASWNDSPNEGRENENEALRLLVKAVSDP
jgi:CubicO group peptidase (beta-lactamase class C family)